MSEQTLKELIKIDKIVYCAYLNSTGRSACTWFKKSGYFHLIEKFSKFFLNGGGSTNNFCLFFTTSTHRYVCTTCVFDGAFSST